MAAVHLSQISVTQTSSYCAGFGHSREIPPVSVVDKYSKAPSLRKGRELHLTLPPSYRPISEASAVRVTKVAWEGKSKHCPDPSETADYYINHEFPDKIVI